jgi:uncharacterized membrane protein
VSGQIDIGGAIGAGWQDVKSNPGALIGGMFVAILLPLIVGMACILGLTFASGMNASSAAAPTPTVAAAAAAGADAANPGDAAAAAASAADAAGAAAAAASTGTPAQAKNPLIILAMAVVGIAMYAAIFIFMCNYMELGLQVARGESVSIGQIVRWNPKVFSLLGVGILTSIISGIGSIVIIGGMIAGVLLAMAPLFVLDRNMGPIDALKASFEATKPHFVTVLLFIIAVSVLNMVGMMALGVGTIVTIPMSMMAMVHVYRTISGAGVSQSKARVHQAA